MVNQSAMVSGRKFSPIFAKGKEITSKEKKPQYTVL